MILLDATWGPKKTKEKIKFSFTWPTIALDVQKVCECCHHCHQCQKRRRSTVYDRTPITPIPRNEISCDILTAGQINTKINHCAIIHEKIRILGTLELWMPQIQTKLRCYQVRKLTWSLYLIFLKMKGHDYWQYLISTQNVFLKHPVFVI